MFDVVLCSPAFAPVSLFTSRHCVQRKRKTARPAPSSRGRREQYFASNHARQSCNTWKGGHCNAHVRSLSAADLNCIRAFTILWTALPPTLQKRCFHVNVRDSAHWLVVVRSLVGNGGTAGQHPARSARARGCQAQPFGAITATGACLSAPPAQCS